MSTKFWNIVPSKKTTDIRIEGYIADVSWFEDDITAKQFATEIKNIMGNINVWINSCGGDCVAASQIYTMLKEHNGKVTVKVDGNEQLQYIL